MIRFDVLFGDNLVADCEAACFGWLAAVNDVWYRRGKIQTNNNKHLADAFTNGGLRPQELVWYVNKSPLLEADRASGWRIVKEFIEEFPWLSDTVLLRPATQTVHVKLGDTPCDKSILCIGIIRNYFLVPSFRKSYDKAKECGASPKEAYIFAALVEYTEDWRNQWSCTTRTLWEYDAVNSATFGKAALKKMLAPDYAPWRQLTWNEQTGYDREHTLRGEVFHGFHGERSGRKLLDTFSVERDEEILHNQESVRVDTNDEVTNIINVIRQAIQA